MLRCTGVRFRVALLAMLSLGLAPCGLTEPVDVGPPDVTGISVSSSTTTIGIGTTLQLTATVTPAGASQSVTWSSSDETRLTVSATGLASAALAPLVAGSVRVTATSALDATLSSFADLTIACGPLVSAAVTNGGTLAEDTCYVVESALTVSGGTLFVEPGVRISFGPSGSLSIRSDGRLNAVGTLDKEITFTSSDAAGSWRGIRFDDSRGADNILRYVMIENGGSDGWSGATQSASALLLEGNSLVDIQQSTIKGSASRGITLYADAEMTFKYNLVRDNDVPAWVHPNTAGYLDAEEHLREQRRRGGPRRLREHRDVDHGSDLAATPHPLRDTASDVHRGPAETRSRRRSQVTCRRQPHRSGRRDADGGRPSHRPDHVRKRGKRARCVARLANRDAVGRQRVPQRDFRVRRWPTLDGRVR